MSHQSGIRPSADLIQRFSNVNGDIRAIQVVISEEQLIPQDTINTSSTWQGDFSSFQTWLAPTSPCFVLYRMDSQTRSGDYEWMILQYVPDNARVRDKMLYASSRVTLTKELGDSKFIDSLYGTTPAEFTLEGYRKHIASKNAEAPKTEREIEMERVKMAENVEIGSPTRKTLVVSSGISFPFSSDATNALHAFKSKSINLLQLRIEDESIHTDKVDVTSAADIAANVSTTNPRFITYRYTNPSTNMDATIFIYICPTASKVKERMLYSSARANVIQTIEESLGNPIAKKVEIDDPNDIQLDWIEDHLFPDSSSTHSNSPALPMGKQPFSKPKPAGRGPTRVTKMVS